MKSKLIGMTSQALFPLQLYPCHSSCAFCPVAPKFMLSALVLGHTHSYLSCFSWMTSPHPSELNMDIISSRRPSLKFFFPLRLDEVSLFLFCLHPVLPDHSICHSVSHRELHEASLCCASSLQYTQLGDHLLWFLGAEVY